jgi:hypothetical protein
MWRKYGNATWQVLDTWKGRLRKDEIFETTTGSSDCAFNPGLGKVSLLYLEGTAPFGIGACTRNLMATESELRHEVELLNRKLKRAK